MKKWKYELIVVVALVCVGSGVWWFAATKNERAVKAKYKQLLEIANQQSVEIAIIEQAARLQQLKQAVAAAQQQQQQALEQAVRNPVIADPKDVDVDR